TFFVAQPLVCPAPLFTPPRPLPPARVLLFPRPGAHPDLPSFPTRRSSDLRSCVRAHSPCALPSRWTRYLTAQRSPATPSAAQLRSEEHTSELQSRFDLVCRLLLEKKKPKDYATRSRLGILLTCARQVRSST